MEHTSRPQPLVIARVFACLTPTVYLNMYFSGRHDNSGHRSLLIDWPLVSPPPKAAADSGATDAEMTPRKMVGSKHTDPRC